MEKGDEMDKEMLKGSIDLLLLSLINQRDLYGYEITKMLKQLSEDSYEMSEGTLYPALKRLERKEWIESYWSETSGGRRKYYRITDSGRNELEKKQQNWKLIENLVKRSSEGLQ
jgi:PadR family transcriptional regulator, regulatory protein PadR